MEWLDTGAHTEECWQEERDEKMEKFRGLERDGGSEDKLTEEVLSDGAAARHIW